MRVVSPCPHTFAGGDGGDIILTGLLAAIALSASWCFVPPVQAVETVYRCDDGSFTNRAEADCFPYEPHGSVTVSPDGQPTPAISDRVKSDTTTMTAVLPPAAGKILKTGQTLCSLYDEWHTLRRTTSGGTVFLRGRDVARWRALSRVFLSVGAPECEVRPTVRAAQASR